VQHDRPLGPDFLCIGATKGGTNWLYANLAHHSGIWLPPVKELRHFNTIHIPGPHQQTDVAHRRQQTDERRARLLEAAKPPPPGMVECLAAMLEEPQDDAWYARIFRYAAPGQLAGDISPQYALLPETGIRHALALNPAVKVVALLRDPASRALSHIAMHCGAGATARDVVAVAEGSRWEAYARHSDYATWLTRWRDLLPAGALHIDTLGRIGAAPVAVLEDVARFLGAPAPPGIFRRAGRPVNAGRADPARLAAALPVLRAKLAPQYAALAALWPDLSRRFAAEEDAPPA